MARARAADERRLPGAICSARNASKSRRRFRFPRWLPRRRRSPRISLDETVMLQENHRVVMIGKIAYFSFLIAIGVSVFVGWRLSLSGKSRELPAWRRRLLSLGFI